ncbi:MAG TPA: serine hydrolase [Caldimonas sp.]|nr:serine hydrolase [Caldimonas sp.]HEX4233854.1 serine hydrolase [Caldimonas sp.]
MALIARSAPAAEAAATPWPTAGWDTSTPEAQGVRSPALAELVDFGAANDMDSLLVVRHGRIVAEATYAPFRPRLRHAVNSVTKAVVGTLVGIAADHGVLRLDEPVLVSFADRGIAHVDADKRALTIAHLLDMTSGIDWREPLTEAPPETMLQMEQSSDWVGFILDRPMARPPGQAFNYDSGDWHLLSAILSKKTGLSTVDYAERVLFEPLGIRDARWRRDPQGIAVGGYGLFLEPRDMAKIGYLYLHQGQWAGQQVVPRAWTDRVFNASVDMRLGTPLPFRYGSGWWTIPDKRAYMAVGFLRQLIIVLPDADVVAVVTGRKHYPFMPLIDRIVAAATSATPLPDDAAGRARLAARIDAAAVEQPSQIAPASPLAREISGRRWQFDRNGLGLRAITLDLTAPEPRFVAEVASAGAGAAPLRIEARIGFDGLFRNQDVGGGIVLAVKGRWRDEKTLDLVVRSLTEGIVRRYAFAFSGGDVEVSFESNQGLRAVLRGRRSD